MEDWALFRVGAVGENPPVQQHLLCLADIQIDQIAFGQAKEVAVELNAEGGRVGDGLLVANRHQALVDDVPNVRGPVHATAAAISPAAARCRLRESPHSDVVHYVSGGGGERDAVVEAA